MSEISSNLGSNNFFNIDDLPFTDDQKEMVLEWFAQKIWRSLDETGHCKSYDPLIIEGKTAHSYIFNFRDGGRHHGFSTLSELEDSLVEEMKLLATTFQGELTQ